MTRARAALLLAPTLAALVLAGCGDPSHAAGASVSKLVGQTAGFLAAPRALARSPKDGALYVVDATDAAPCSFAGCVRRVEPSTGAVEPAAVFVGADALRSIAFDTTGDALYLGDSGGRLTRLAWTGSGYGSPTACVDLAVTSGMRFAALAVHPTLGLLAADEAGGHLLRVATCASTTSPTVVDGAATAGLAGLAIGPTGDPLASSRTQAIVVTVNQATGAVSTWAGSGLTDPRGLAWRGGAVASGGSLLIADAGAHALLSSDGLSVHRVSAIAGSPVGVVTSGEAAWVLAAPEGATGGALYVVSGF